MMMMAYLAKPIKPLTVASSAHASLPPISHVLDSRLCGHLAPADAIGLPR